MKQILTVLCMLVSTSAFAAAIDAELVNANPEVKSAVAAFEKNRDQRCSKITEESVQIEPDSHVTVTISCNQYDANNEPQANVYFITIKGLMYPDFFSLNSISFDGAE